ncbi:putative lipoprotein YerB [Aeromicrobium flavum]|uniref:Putative lipoprotein YerB n=2 Tax=Aeromicrobium flavum TaxID=416568 RepID=A0A512HV47_9ACTN|nr:putative lipoprotein YerB [Aeromicrobium flavum]
MLSVTCALLLSVGACSGGEEKTSEPDPKEPNKTTAAKIAAVNPLTGGTLAKAPANPVFVVKIDNTPASAPQTSVDKADLVVEQTVEGGITRLAALFYTRLPGNVGHVRSMRATDIGIAKPVRGQVVASGGAGRTISRIKDAGIPIHSQDAGSPGLSRDSGSAPYNVVVDLARLTKDVKNTQPERPYFQWSPAGAAAPKGPQVTSASVKFSRTHTTSWRFNGKAWKRTNGTSAKEFGAKNLVVLWADEKDAGYTDPAGNRVPETTFEGSGKAVVFVGGTRVNATWKKPNNASTIVLRTRNGQAMTLPRGKTWIELLSKNESTALSAK